MSDLLQILIGDSAEMLATLESGSIPIVVTSPPYDNLRSYGGHSWNFETTARELYRVMSDGGIVCWNVGDSVVDGSETLTSFRQALFFKDVCGFRVHDTMLYAKTNGAKPDPTRYNQCFEYVFILTKGAPSTANLIRDKANVTAGKKALGRWTVRQHDGTMKEREYRKEAAEFGVRPNIWVGLTRGQEEACQPLPHPAMMPKWLARDLILSWSNPGDLVCDPMAGSGTVAAQAIATGRRALAIDADPSCEPLIIDSCNITPGLALL